MSKTKTFFVQLPANIFSGFVVSLIALPLGLGLAIASEAPPMAGIVASVVGGVMVALLGGSHLTITGPGNGLVIVLLGAITTLGSGDLYQGYLFTLAAIIVSGLLLILFGFLRLGNLSEFFPASALQGMLAAIGLGILAKQFHLMMGISDVSGDTLQQLLQIPKSVVGFFSKGSFNENFAGWIGVGSLVFLFLYSRIRNPYFHLIPAPMWVVLATVGAGYYFLLILGHSAPIDSSLLIHFPENFLSSFPRPDFGKWNTMDFAGVVVAITLIASIESLLSIKAVDKLDPQKRRSNVNKDLKALGIATAVSGFLGGLNVVTVIARSSVNVNNGGANRSANFFHAAFLVLFLLIFSAQIQLIPITALAAILVFTGYKLAAPGNLLRISKIGKEQAFIFLTTLIATLVSNLILGITIGIVTTFLVHIFLTRNLLLFTRNIFKPNVLAYKEEETGNYYVSVKDFCNFLNFFRLKAKLDQIPQAAHAIIDFSLCEFVDHTVMEELHDYQRSFAKKEGVFELIGLDIYEATTAHPFAVRRSAPFRIRNLLKIEMTLSKRQQRLQKLATVLGWKYVSEFILEASFLERFLFFKTKTIHYRYNTLENDEGTFRLFDLYYSEGVFIMKEDLKGTFLLLTAPSPLPVFVLDKEDIRATIYQFKGFKDINFKNHPDFSKRFFLSGDDPRAIRKWFTPELIFFFESHPQYHIESNGKALLIKGKDRLASIQEVKNMFAFADEMMRLLRGESLA